VVMMTAATRLKITNVAVEYSASLLSVVEIRGSNLGQTKCYLHRGFASLCSVFPSGCQRRHIFTTNNLIKGGAP
jgi:hypothetical protein